MVSKRQRFLWSLVACLSALFRLPSRALGAPANPVKSTTNAVAAQSKPNQDAPEKVVVLRQTWADFGFCIVTVSPTLVHVRGVQKQFEVLSQAPRWDVVVFDRRGKMSSCSLKDWSHIGFSSLPRPVPPLPAQATSRETFLTHSALRYTLGADTLATGATLFFRIPGLRVQSQQYVYCDDITKALQPRIVLSALYGYPVGPGLPVECIGVHVDKTRFFSLKTQSIRDEQVVVSTLLPPPHLAVVKAPINVLVSTRDETTLNDLLLGDDDKNAPHSVTHSSDSTKKAPLKN